MVLYAVSAVYFAGVMVRLMLTLTPVVCILSAIAFSSTFDIYLDDRESFASVEEDTTTSSKRPNIPDIGKKKKKEKEKEKDRDMSAMVCHLLSIISIIYRYF